jgi:hypothetical protein
MSITVKYNNDGSTTIECSGESVTIPARGTRPDATTTDPGTSKPTKRGPIIGPRTNILGPRTMLGPRIMLRLPEFESSLPDDALQLTADAFLNRATQHTDLLRNAQSLEVKLKQNDAISVTKLLKQMDAHGLHTAQLWIKALEKY